MVPDRVYCKERDERQGANHSSWTGRPRGVSPPQNLSTVFAQIKWFNFTKPGQETGDLIFILKTKPHKTFQRSGADLLVTVHVTLSEALTGFNRVVVTHLDGRGIRIASPPNKIVRSGDSVKVSG